MYRPESFYEDRSMNSYQMRVGGYPGYGFSGLSYSAASASASSQSYSGGGGAVFHSAPAMMPEENVDHRYIETEENEIQPTSKFNPKVVEIRKTFPETWMFDTFDFNSR